MNIENKLTKKNKNTNLWDCLVVRDKKLQQLQPETGQTIIAKPLKRKQK